MLFFIIKIHLFDSIFITKFWYFRVSAWTYRCIITCPTTGQRIQSQPVTIEGSNFILCKEMIRITQYHCFLIHTSFTVLLLFYSFNICKDTGKELTVFQNCSRDMSGGLFKCQILSSFNGAETGWRSINCSSQTTRFSGKKMILLKACHQ